MADILPSTPDLRGAEEREPRVIGVDADDADDVLAALSSDTARNVLASLHDEPGPASGVADRVGTSLQNAQYHLRRLKDAGLVEVAGTAYSEKGREMDVYAPADRALVLVAGREEDTRGLKGTLARLLGAVAVLGVASAFVEFLLGGPMLGAKTAGGDAADAEAVSSQSTEAGGARATETAMQVATDAQTVAEPTLLETLASSPGAMFFAGGLVAIVLVGAYLRYRR